MNGDAIDGKDGNDRDFETRPPEHSTGGLDSGVDSSDSDESCVSANELLASGSRDGVSWSLEEDDNEEDNEEASESGDASKTRARSDAPGQPEEPGPTALQGQWSVLLGWWTALLSQALPRVPAEPITTVLSELHGLESWIRQAPCSDVLRLVARRADELADVVSRRGTAMHPHRWASRIAVSGRHSDTGVHVKHGRGDSDVPTSGGCSGGCSGGRSEARFPANGYGLPTTTPVMSPPPRPHRLSPAPPLLHHEDARSSPRTDMSSVARPMASEIESLWARQVELWHRSDCHPRLAWFMVNIFGTPAIAVQWPKGQQHVLPALCGVLSQPRCKSCTPDKGTVMLIPLVECNIPGVRNPAGSDALKPRLLPGWYHPPHLMRRWSQGQHFLDTERTAVNRCSARIQEKQLSRQYRWRKYTNRLAQARGVRVAKYMLRHFPALLGGDPVKPPDDGLSSAPTPLAPRVEAASNNLQPRTASAAHKAPVGAHVGIAAGAGGAEGGARRRGTHGNTGAAAAASTAGPSPPLPVPPQATPTTLSVAARAGGSEGGRGTHGNTGAAAAASTAGPSPPLPVPPQATPTTLSVAARAGGAEEGARRCGTHGNPGAAGSQASNPSASADDAAVLLSLTAHGPSAAARAIAPTPNAAVDVTTDSTQLSPAVSRVHPQQTTSPSGSGSTDTQKRPRQPVRRGTTVGERMSRRSRKKARLNLHRGRDAENDSRQSRNVGASPSNEAEGCVPATRPRIVHGGGAMRHHGQEALGAQVSNGTPQASGTSCAVLRKR